jgi:hypothetical protein
MEFLESIDWRKIDWITPAIHLYAIVVFVLVMMVYSIHRYRRSDLARRVASIARHIEGMPHRGPGTVDLDHLTGLILHLSDLVQRRQDLDLLPVLDFLRMEERQRHRGVGQGLVNLTETMIDLLPVLGILGTVYAISGVSKEDFSSERLLFLFGVAVSTTLWALLYVFIFRILYAAFVGHHVDSLSEQVDRYRELLVVLEQKCALAGSEVANAPHATRPRGAG